MVDLKGRKRVVDIEAMTDEEFQQIVDMLGKRFKNLCENASKEANFIAKPYGFKVNLQFSVEPLNKEQ